MMLVVMMVIVTVGASPTPQPSDPNLLQNIFGTPSANVDPDVLRSIFGTDEGESGYSGIDVSVEDRGTMNVLRQLAEAEEQSVDVEQLPKYEHCSDYTERFGYECVPYYQCANGSIITDGEGLLDVRSTLNAEESKCPGPLDVCCKDAEFVPPAEPAVQYQPKCGKRNAGGLSVRIQGFTDSESQFGEWPHMCALLREELVEEDVVQVFQCGASLLEPGVLLTAGHCVDKLREVAGTLVVRCGEWDTQAASEPRPHQDRRVKQVVVHPEFNARNLHNDFALLFTEQDFVLDSHIDTVCLPEPGQKFNFQTCFATGWGKDKFGAEGQYQVVLKEVDLPVVEHSACEAGLRRTRLGRRFRLHSSFLCAGGIAGKDTCKGDGGSPLVCEGPGGSYMQAGVVAWGLGCGGDTPGVYAAVSEAACWLDMQITCRAATTTGDFRSRLGYTKQACGTWLDRKKQQVARSPRLFAEYSKCEVIWTERDVSTLARVQASGLDLRISQTSGGAINFG